jgi:hypothetical protein
MLIMLLGLCTVLLPLLYVLPRVETTPRPAAMPTHAATVSDRRAWVWTT